MNFKATRQLNKHDGSSVCPVELTGLSIIAIDSDGVEHHSAHSTFHFSDWLWDMIIFWRYDDSSLIEIATYKVAELEDKIEKLSKCDD